MRTAFVLWGLFLALVQPSISLLIGFALSMSEYRHPLAAGDMGVITYRRCDEFLYCGIFIDYLVLILFFEGFVLIFLPLTGRWLTVTTVGYAVGAVVTAYLALFYAQEFLIFFAFHVMALIGLHFAYRMHFKSAPITELS